MFTHQKIKLWIITLCIVMGTAVYATEPHVVSYLDLSKYQGKWFEIYRFPNPFQTKCQKNVTAEYRLLENGYIEVINSCVQENGTTDRVKGLAQRQDAKSNAKLEVSFFDIFGWRPVWGDYWVLYVDATYKVAVVGDRQQKYGWVLSRSNALSKAQLATVMDVLDTNHYDSNKLRVTLHD